MTRRPPSVLPAIALAVILAGCASGGASAPQMSQSAFSPALGIDLAQMTRTPDGLYYRDDPVGGGETATERSRVVVAYRSLLANGAVVDSSTGIAIRLGQRQVIKGWDLGIPGMRVGGARILVVPPELGYGSLDRPGVPPNSIMIFRVQLVRVQ